MLLRKPLIRAGRINFFAADVTCYVLRGTKGDLLIDTGLPQHYQPMQQWLRDYNIRWVFLTHAHPDHDWNAAKFQKSGAKIILSVLDRDLRRNFLSQRVMPTSPRYALRNVVQCIGGGIVKSPPYDADIYFGEQDTGLLRTLGFDAEIVPLPGHTYGSSGILSKGVLYCGDAYTTIFGKPELTPHAVSPQLALDSLRTIAALHPDRLACGHGLPVRYADAEPEIRQRLSEAHAAGSCKNITR